MVLTFVQGSIYSGIEYWERICQGRKKLCFLKTRRLRETQSKAQCVSLKHSLTLYPQMMTNSLTYLNKLATNAADLFK